MSLFTLDNPTVAQMNGIPTHFTDLLLDNPNIDAIKAIPAHIKHLVLTNPSVDVIKALPVHLKWLALKNFNVAAIKAMPVNIKCLGLTNPNVDAIQAMPLHIAELYIPVNADDQSAIIEILKTRPAGFKLYINQELTLETKPATAAIVAPPLTLLQPRPPTPPPPVVAPTVVTPPTPTLTPAYAALQAENERLRKRLRATETLADAQAGVINTLRAELADYATPGTNAKRMRMVQ